MRPRGLAEMVGNDLFFAELHRTFVALLQCLGRHFGGVVVESPCSDEELSERYHEDHDTIEEQITEKINQTHRMPSALKPAAVA